MNHKEEMEELVLSIANPDKDVVRTEDGELAMMPAKESVKKPKTYPAKKKKAVRKKR